MAIAVSTRMWVYGALAIFAAVLIAKAPKRPPPVSLASNHRASSILPAPANTMPVSRTKPDSMRLERPMLEPAIGDPFATPSPSQASKPLPAAAPIVSVVPPPAPLPPVPVAPPLGLQFVGRATAPDQSETIYVNDGQADLALRVGDDLPNGYRVESIQDRTIKFEYPPLKTFAELDLPPPPKYQSR